jgi:Flp pilus assembly protein TadD
MRPLSLCAAACAMILATSPAAAQQGAAQLGAAQKAEIGYPKDSLAYRAIAAGNYAKAERQLTSELRIAKDDPARLINHGRVLAKTGRYAEAAQLFEQAMQVDEIELILADGRVMSSREAARRALASVSIGGPEADEE